MENTYFGRLFVRVQTHLGRMIIARRKNAVNFVAIILGIAVVFYLLLWIGIDYTFTWSVHQDGVGKEVNMRKLDDCQSEYNSYTVHLKGSLHNAQSHDPTVKCRRDRINPPDACTYWKAKLKKEVNLCTQKRHYFCVQVPRKKDGTTFYASDSITFDCSYARKRCLLADYGVIDNRTGRLEFFRIEAAALDEKLTSLYNKRVYDFAFIKCTVQDYTNNIQHGSAHFSSNKSSAKIEIGKALKNFTGEQLIQFIHRPVPAVSGLNKDKKKPSVSLIFVDSLSRTGAFQSFPKTIELLRRLNVQSRDQRVLDFRLMHSVFPGTYWNLENLWMGEQAAGSIHNEFYYFESRALSEPFQRMGYQTAYIHDTCYHWPWRTNDHSSSDKRRLNMYFEEFQKSSFTTTGITLAACEILARSTGEYKAYTSKDVCLNGDYEVRHRFENLFNIQKNFEDHNYPFFTVVELNLNHNGDGTNAKHMDIHLANYLEKIIRQPDVMTIIHSDHGNRLVTARDIHYIVKKFTDPSGTESLYNKKGALVEIDKGRNCDSIRHFTKGNFFCICEPSANESRIMDSNEVERALEFSREYLNERIDDFPGCATLQLTRWGDKPYRLYYNKTAKEDAIVKGHLFTTYEKKKIIFAIELFKNVTTGVLHFKEYLRLDKYDKYKECVPPKAEVQLCLCDRRGRKQNKRALNDPNEVTNALLKLPKPLIF
ncbi:uncharacterized protein LOC142341574 isoform X2 [Convolutriloba macropyga]|uniref:uncharacterized protein LOC142341574 isoform X2 n=1 Tax=Convolutriloba macropyga TaxID=536237 RepID=UPI003F51E8D4